MLRITIRRADGTIDEVTKDLPAVYANTKTDYYAKLVAANRTRGAEILANLAKREAERKPD